MEDKREYYFYGKGKELPSLSLNNKTEYGCFYRCYKGARNELCFHAHTFKKKKAGQIYASESQELLLTLRKWFIFSGKINLVNTKKNSLMGVFTRGGKIYDYESKIIARYKSTATWKGHLGEAIIDLIGEMIFGGGGDNSGSTNEVGDYYLIVGKEHIGHLKRSQLPFFPDPPKRKKPGKVAKFFKKVLPKNLGSFLFDITPPCGWKLELFDETKVQDMNLLLYGTLMFIEIKRW